LYSSGRAIVWQPAGVGFESQVPQIRTETNSQRQFVSAGIRTLDKPLLYQLSYMKLHFYYCKDFVETRQMLV